MTTKRAPKHYTYDPETRNIVGPRIKCERISRDHGSIIADLLDIAYDAGRRDGASTMTSRIAAVVKQLDDVLDDDPITDRNAEKRAAVEAVLARGAALITLDARLASVHQHLADDHKLVFRIGYDLRPPIPDLDLDEFGISATLSFPGVLHLCEVPWEAVWALAPDGFPAPELIKWWAECTPDEVMEKMAREAMRDKKAEPKARPRLSLVPEMPNAVAVAEDGTMRELDVSKMGYLGADDPETIEGVVESVSVDGQTEPA